MLTTLENEIVKTPQLQKKKKSNIKQDITAKLMASGMQIVLHEHKLNNQMKYNVIQNLNKTSLIGTVCVCKYLMNGLTQLYYL